KNSFLSLRFLHWLTSHCGFSPDQSSCDVLFDALVDAGACKAAKLLLGYPHFIPKNASLECYIRCLSNGGMVEEAFDVFVSLKKVGFLPSVSTFNVSLLACLKVGRTDLVWKLYEHMLESADLVGFRVFNDLKDRGYFPDNIMYTTVNKGLCDIGWFGEARKLWFEMIHKGLVSNEYTYNVMIYGYCKIGDFVEARKLYEDMCGRGYAENVGLEPSVSSFTPLIKKLCEVGDIEGAKRLLKDMHHRHLEPIATHDYIIIGLCKEGNLTQGMEWFAKHAELEAETQGADI
ncbi:pentatricopeptide repeat-containing protein at5g18950-like protein, partial [Trifolium pratense]